MDQRSFPLHTVAEIHVNREEQDEISSLSDFSQDSQYRIRDKTGKTIKRGKLKRKREVKRDAIISLNEPRILRTSVYDKFINLHCAAFNSGDAVRLQDEVLLPNVGMDFVTLARHWARPKATDPAPPNPMGQYNYVELYGIEDSITYCTQFYNLVPDYLLQVAPPNIVTMGETSKAICPFTFTGTLVTKITLPQTIVENPNNYVKETREALVEADPWAPPPGQSFQNEKTVRKYQADDIEMEITGTGTEASASSTERGDILLM